jgi:hypothetical protein
MNSPPWNDAISSAELGIFNLPPKFLMFCNQVLTFENIFLISPLDQCNWTSGFLRHLQNSSWF